MTVSGAFVALSPHDYDAVLFDLDGVLTRTARVHAAAWKQLFEVLRKEKTVASDPAASLSLRSSTNALAPGTGRESTSTMRTSEAASSTSASAVEASDGAEHALASATMPPRSTKEGV